MKTKLTWMQSTLIAVIILVILLLSGCQQQIDPSKSILVTDYDVNGNIIRQEEIPFLQPSNKLQAVTVPDEYVMTYIETMLPDVPVDAVTRNLKIIVTNNGNVKTEVEILQAKYHGEFTS